MRDAQTMLSVLFSCLLTRLCLSLPAAALLVCLFRALPQVIIAAFCVSGCAFNKFHGGKSGWALIPCSEQAAACFDSAQTGGRAKHWTPQENTYDPAETVSSGGGGYQSYSNNL